MGKETGGPAFPWQEVLIDGNGNSWSNQREGMTLRDYFAAKAMMGAFSSGAYEINMGPSHIDEMKGLAITFYLMADAMLEARKE